MALVKFLREGLGENVRAIEGSWNPFENDGPTGNRLANHGRAPTDVARLSVWRGSSGSQKSNGGQVVIENDRGACSRETSFA